MYHYQHNVMGEQLTGKMVASADVLDAAVRRRKYCSCFTGLWTVPSIQGA